MSGINEDKIYNKNNQILHYFNNLFNENCKYNCKEYYDNLVTCFNNKKRNNNNQTNLNNNKSFDKYNECFEQANSYFICLSNETTNFEDL